MKGWLENCFETHTVIEFSSGRQLSNRYIRVSVIYLNATWCSDKIHLIVGLYFPHLYREWSSFIYGWLDFYIKILKFFNTQGRWCNIFVFKFFQWIMYLRDFFISIWSLANNWLSPTLKRGSVSEPLETMQVTNFEFISESIFIVIIATSQIIPHLNEIWFIAQKSLWSGWFKRI